MPSYVWIIMYMYKKHDCISDGLHCQGHNDCLSNQIYLSVTRKTMSATKLGNQTVPNEAL